MNKISALFGLMFTLLTVSSNSHACAGGGEVVLNDDTILVAQGLRAPLSEPEQYISIDIEKKYAQIQACQNSAVESGNIGGLLSGSKKCPSHIFRVFDSNKKATHRVAMFLNKNIATYLVEDLSTGKTTKYTAELHTRGLCGLQEVKEN